MDTLLVFILAIISIAETSRLWDKYFSRQDEELFLCYNRPDGTYALQNPFRYLVCKSGIAKTHDCDKGEVFVPTCNKCLIQIHAQRGSFCNGRVGTFSNGRVIKYQNPWDCKSWFECIDGITEEYLCDLGLQFSSKEQQCVMEARECKLAQHKAKYSSKLFLGKPRNIDAALLWPDKDIILFDSSMLYKFKVQNAALINGYPMALNNHSLSKIPFGVDASLTMPDQKVHFFKGNKVWTWGSDRNPRYIKDEWAGVPDNLDAAFYWKDKRKVYFFKKEYFYRFDPTSGSIENGYPKLITQGWPGALASIDAAVSLENGTVFLFKKQKVLTFHPPICKALDTLGGE